MSEQSTETTTSEPTTSVLETAEPAAPVVRVVAGQPTPEELAALLAVLAAAGGDDAGEGPDPAPSRWSAPGARLRTAYGAGSGAWRASGMPR